MHRKVPAGFGGRLRGKGPHPHRERDLAAQPILFANALRVRADRLRGIVARWRKAGYAETGTLATGPAWCWLTSAGMKATGLGYPATRPSLGRLAHIRAVLTVRLWLEAGEAYQNGQAWWRSERRIRAAIGGPVSAVHVPTPSPLAHHGRLPICRADVGHRGGTDPQAAGPHGGDHADPAGPHQRLRPRRHRPGPSPVRPGDLPDRPARRPGGDPRDQRAARTVAAPHRGPRPARRSIW